MRRTRLALSAFHTAEAVLLGIGAGCAMQGAIVLSGGEVRSIGAWVAAALAGVLCACAWRLEHPSSEAGTARALDQGLRQQGGLFAAWEAEKDVRSPLRASMARLLGARVLSGIQVREAVRSTMPSVALSVAAPLFGAAALALSFEIREAGRDAPGVELRGLARGLVESSLALSTELEAGLDPETQQASELEALSLAERCASRARALQEGLDRSRAGEAAGREGLGAAGEIQRDLERLSLLLGSREGLRERVAEVQNALDSARRALRAAEAAGGQGGRGVAAPDVTGGREPGTMPALVPDRDTRAPRALEEPPVPERGSLAGTTWPVEYDGIVSEWVERARRLANEPPEGRPLER